ncbi:MAG: hypothetical protein NE334_20675 [Lentisphaeraceae bacterium]|nr:hypothetical protein [Lentisphaeraceae bacterium]
MEYISTDLLKEGMTVAKDVHSQSQMLLLPAGTELSASKIRTLITWGVRRIFIEATEDLEATQNIIKQKEADNIIDTMFIHNPNNDFIHSLKMAAARNLRRKMSEEL